MTIIIIKDIPPDSWRIRYARGNFYVLKKTLFPVFFIFCFFWSQPSCDHEVTIMMKARQSKTGWNDRVRRI